MNPNCRIGWLAMACEPLLFNFNGSAAIFVFIVVVALYFSLVYCLAFILLVKNDKLLYFTIRKWSCNCKKNYRNDMSLQLWIFVYFFNKRFFLNNHFIGDNWHCKEGSLEKFWQINTEFKAGDMGTKCAECVSLTEEIINLDIFLRVS